MPIEFIQRLSITLTRKSILIVLVLGALMSCLQIYFDYLDQRSSINDRMQKIIEVSSTPAERAVHHLDNDLAREVVNGLTKYDFIHHIAVYDDSGEIMAIHDEPIENTETLWLTRIIMGDSTTFSHELTNFDDRYKGKMVIKTNNDKALSPIYQRSLYLFFTELARNIFLAIILVLLYHRYLTRPLFNIAHNLSSLGIQRDASARLAKIHGHEDNELGQIIDSTNRLLDTLQSREKEIEQNEEQLRIILNSSPNQVFSLDENGRFVFLNTATSRFYRDTVANLENKSFFDAHRVIDENEAMDFHLLFKQVTTQHESIQREKVLHDADGVERIINLTFIPYIFYDKPCVLVVANDVTARVEAENRVERLAYFDTLTQLPNKHQIQKQLQEDLRLTKKHNRYGALLFIDIDNFKRINDSVSHSVGDALLLKISNRMQTQIRKTETLARLGGDEFVLSVPNIADKKEKAKETVRSLAERLLKSIRQPIMVNEHEFNVSASIGIALYPEPKQTVDRILSSADTAMYQAKARGRDHFVIFQPRMSEEASRLMKLESDIRKALADDHFTFYLQAQVDAKTNKIKGAEALLRWHHPERGVIFPGEFINYLESSPMIVQSSRQILNKVCAFIYSCKNQSIIDDEFRVSVNVSAREFYQADFVPYVLATLDRYHLDGSCLEFEITEGAALLHLDQTLEKMKQLKEKGVRFALDDFGTGYSSLSYLKQLPVDKIKIDKSFIRDVTVDKQDEMLVASVIAIAHTLEMEVVAEGIETAEQEKWLQQYDNVQYQGYFFQKPMPANQFKSEYLENPAN